MGFDTTKTTELKSVGDAVQVVALLIGGAITLNIPNCMCCPVVHIDSGHREHANRSPFLFQPAC
jgi:hypothetical protein